MKNIIYICLGLTAVLMLCLIPAKTTEKSGENTTVQMTVQSRYTVREYEGQIGIFAEGGEMPVQVFDTAVFLLPESDRKLLEKGITVDTPEELQKIIEDFTG